MTNRYTLPLADVLAELAIAGGKGASLARMVRAGLPVPDGFHVTTAAYRRFVDENALQSRILEALQVVEVDQPATLAAVSAQIATLFAAGVIPSEVVVAVDAAYAALSDAARRESSESAADPLAVAVRSSATAEDLPEASFAGQQETFLNVRGVADVLAALKRCWASLWTARAIVYRARQGIAPGEVSLAVVVQRLIPAEAAGIIFTANPVNGRRDQMLVNASWGLGEAVVGGEVTPDEWVLDKSSGAIIQTQIACKTVQTVRHAGGTRTQAVPAERQMQPSLEPAELKSLHELARRAEAYFGSPQDIEWAWNAGRGYLTQSRPITTLMPQPTPLALPDQGLRIYLCVNVVLQGITEPFTPMGWEVFRLLFLGMMDGVTGKTTSTHPFWIKKAAGRMYLDITNLLRNPKRWLNFSARIASKDPSAGRALLRALEANAEEIKAGEKAMIPAVFFLKLLPPMTWRTFYSYLAPCRARQRLLADGEAKVAAMKAEAQALTSLAERLDYVETAGRTLYWAPIFQVAYCASGLRGLQIIPRLLDRWLGDSAMLHPVLQALPHNPTTEMGLDLLHIAQQIKEEGVEPTLEHPALQAFLGRFGHRAIREIDTGLPRWREDPAYILQMIAAYIERDDLTERVAEFHAAAERAESAIPEIVAAVRSCKGWLAARIMAHFLRCLRETGGLREQPKFDMVRSFVVLRDVLHDIGQTLVAQGALADADDVFYLTLDAIRAGGDLREQSAAARAAYLREVERLGVPRIMTSSGESLHGGREDNSDANLLIGAPVSAGVYEGVVHIVHSPIGAKLEPGEVLVTHSSDPSWTPLFLNAGAVVMEIGGPISHGAIVAREYGIPAVASVNDATTRLHDGQRVRINGESGEIVLLEDQV